jgi:hypothetical protein
MKSSLSSCKSKKAACLLCNQMQTYSVDFFLTALFTRKACHDVSVAGGGVSPAGGVVPATAMVTAAVANGPAPSSSGSVLGEEVEGLQKGHCQRITILMFGNSPKHQINTCKIRLLQLFASAPTDDPAVPKVELRSTPRLARRSCPFSPLLRLLSPPGGSRPPWSRCYAEPGLCEPSLLRQWHWEEVVRPGDVESRRVAAVYFCVSLQKVFS